MIRVVQFSGGKDSTALVLWAREHFGENFTPLFCDTGWEHPITYDYIANINVTVLANRLITVRSSKYRDMEDLVTRKGRVPSVKARFCTQELKVFPTRDYLRTLSDDYVIYQGIRADESAPRLKAGPRLWSDEYDCFVNRPLFRWPVAAVFAIHARHGIEPNPLYKLGAVRVGCFPCVMVNHGELKRLGDTLPEIWERAATLERAATRTFFPPEYIPVRFCRSRDEATGIPIPTVADVKRYLKQADEAQIKLFDTGRESGCMSVYNLCE
jgi:3'-phosphoadenosine 5'-phosphosulfate sulfotransferase (PAPS reductase)/FAD synthetase